MTNETPEDLLTVGEAARALRESRPTVYRQIQTGQLEAYRIGEHGPLRIPRSAIDELLRPARRIAA